MQKRRFGKHKRSTATPASPTQGRRTRHTSTPFSEFVVKAVVWLWPNYVARGKLTLLAGEPGDTKTLLGLDLAARITWGNPFPGEAITKHSPGKVVILSSEDDPEDTLLPRLKAAGADLSKVLNFNPVVYGRAGASRLLRFPKDLHRLEVELRRHPDTRAIIIDPVSSFFARVNLKDEAATRAAFDPLQLLARKYNVAIMGICHLIKSSRTSRLAHRISGSHGAVAAARSAMVVVRDRSNPKRRHLIIEKANIAQDHRVASYEIETVDVPDAGQVPRIRWLPPEDWPLYEEALGAPSPQAPRRTRLELATELARGRLNGEPVPANALFGEAREKGISKMTMYRALRFIGADSIKRNDGFCWRLPPKN